MDKIKPHDWLRIKFESNIIKDPTDCGDVV